MIKAADKQVAWQANLSDEAQLPGLTLEKVKLSKERRSCEAFFSLLEYIPYDRARPFLSQITELLPGCDQVEVFLRMPTPDQDGQLNWKACLDFALARVLDMLPAAKQCIRVEQTLINGSDITLTVTGDQALDFLRQRKFDRMLCRMMEETFGLKVQLKLLPLEDDGYQAYLERRDSREKAAVRQADAIPPLRESSVNKRKAPSANAGGEGAPLAGKPIHEPSMPIAQVDEECGRVAVAGQLLDDPTVRILKNGKKLINFDITDQTSSISVKFFIDPKQSAPLEEYLKEGVFIKVKGDCRYDSFTKDIVLMGSDAVKIPPAGRMDHTDQKRIELHLHTKMSALDSVLDVSKAIALLGRWGHRAVAVTDHGVIQAFPAAYTAAKKAGIQLIFGMEAYLSNDMVSVVTAPNERDFHQRFCVIDFETTGLSAAQDQIIEIGAVQIENLQVTDTFSAFIKPTIPLSPKITKLTGITSDMLADAPSVQSILPAFLDFIGDSVLVAHNAAFDMGFLRAVAGKMGKTLDNPVLDTLSLARRMFPALKAHKLDMVCKHMNIALDGHHRAHHDAAATGAILTGCLKILSDQGVETLGGINRALAGVKARSETYHTMLLVQNQKGLENLYRLVSLSHMAYYYRKPVIPKSALITHREGLLVGGACQTGELYRAIVENADDGRLHEIARFYDYFEVQPLDNNRFLIREGKAADDQVLIAFNKRVLHIAQKQDKLVVATGDVHFIEPQDEYYRRILMYGQKFEDADQQPALYLRTTEEMLREFDYLPPELANELVVENPERIRQLIEPVTPIPEGLHAPIIEGAEQEIEQIAMATMRRIYGDHPPELVCARLRRELDAIIGNGYAVLYLIAHKLVKKSMDDGYVVGSRGSVGSSFAATMCGITEINPLPPHYICPQCHYCDFEVDHMLYPAGLELPYRECPSCATPLHGEGYNIPFEVFMGFKGNKVPDIDLNFSGDYQPAAHRFVKELFGEDHVFRAGTISGIAERKAYGFVMNYLDEHGLTVPAAEITRLKKGCTGVKQTTGQHPGGIIVVPRNMDIHQFTPIQHPADDPTDDIVTTHFDFHAIHDSLVKLDILGHDAPTFLRMFQELTDIDVLAIDITDPNILSLFTTAQALGVNLSEIGCRQGTLGIPEMGTAFVRQMLEDTQPTTVSELVRISGLSHGTNVWLNNAQVLVRTGTATLKQVICTRDDIMNTLLDMGLAPLDAFEIMESVRRGKGLTEKMEQAMVEKDVPQWFIDSCKKIEYLFPKAHAAAYVVMALRIAYFKVYEPKVFYAVYFSIRCDEFNAERMIYGIEPVREYMQEIRDKDDRSEKLTAKEDKTLSLLEIIYEMYRRNIHFEHIDLYRSDATRFQITEQGILPPLTAISGLGETVAHNICAAREEGEFISIEDLQNRAKVSKSVTEMLKTHHCLHGLAETGQVTLFESL